MENSQNFSICDTIISFGEVTIALDIWELFKAVCQWDCYKAQIVAVDREAAVLDWAALPAVIAADLERQGTVAEEAQAQADAMIACIYSKNQEDDKYSERPHMQAVRDEFKAHYLDDDGEKDANLDAVGANVVTFEALKS